MAASVHYLCCFSFLLFGRLIVCRTHFTSKDVSQDLCHSVLMCSNLKKKSFQFIRIWNLNAPYVFAICVLHFIWKTTLIDIQSYQKIVAHFYTLGSMVTLIKIDSKNSLFFLSGCFLQCLLPAFIGFCLSVNVFFTCTSLFLCDSTFR